MNLELLWSFMRASLKLIFERNMASVKVKSHLKRPAAAQLGHAGKKISASMLVDRDAMQADLLINHRA